MIFSDGSEGRPPKNVWECVYCGRYIRDSRAVHRVVVAGWLNRHACPICKIVADKRPVKSLEKQRARIARILNITPQPDPKTPLKVFVDRYGDEFLSTVTWDGIFGPVIRTYGTGDTGSGVPKEAMGDWDE